MSLGLPDQTVSDLKGVQRNFERLAALIYTGRGSPENKVAAAVGSIYLREDGGLVTTLYVKESGGASNTGWRAV